MCNCVVILEEDGLQRSWLNVGISLKNPCFYPHDGSMVLLYMVCHGSHQYTPVMLAYIPAPWIRHGIYFRIVMLLVYHIIQSTSRPLFLASESTGNNFEMNDTYLADATWKPVTCEKKSDVSEGRWRNLYPKCHWIHLQKSVNSWRKQKRNKGFKGGNILMSCVVLSVGVETWKTWRWIQTIHGSGKHWQSVNVSLSGIPSGKHTKSYWKWP